MSTNVLNENTIKVKSGETIGLDAGNNIIGQVKLTDGTDTADIIAVNSCKGLVAISPGHVSTDNSTTSTLSADAVYTGTWEDITNFGVIVITLKASHASATNGLMVEFSSDGTNVDSDDTFTIPANTGKTFSFQAATQYYRVKYTNGGSDQTSFRLQTTLKPYYVKPSSHRIQDNIIDDDDAELNMSVLKLRTAQDTYVSGAATSSGNFKTSLEELESGISSNSNSQLNTTQFDSSGNELFNSVANAGTIQLTDGNNSRIAGIDGSTYAQNFIKYEHHKIHGGSHYFVIDYQDLSINNVLDFTWQMPNTTKWIHWSWSISVESETLWQVYEGATATNPLSNAITPRNNNRNSANTSGTTMKFEKQTDLAAANADTDVSGATLIEQGIAGAGKDAGDEMRERELILKQNTLYCLRATATAAGYINFKMEWYEHTNKE